ncbi:11456_t:CDS:2, partial [Dentiscutata erythropus]
MTKYTRKRKSTNERKIEEIKQKTIENINQLADLAKRLNSSQVRKKESPEDVEVSSSDG